MLHTTQGPFVLLLEKDVDKPHTVKWSRAYQWNANLLGSANMRSRVREAVPYCFGRQPALKPE